MQHTRNELDHVRCSTVVLAGEKACSPTIRSYSNRQGVVMHPREKGGSLSEQIMYVMTLRSNDSTRLDDSTQILRIFNHPHLKGVGRSRRTACSGYPAWYVECGGVHKRRRPRTEAIPGTQAEAENSDSSDNGPD